jgi:hypothetical protein
LPSLPLRDVKSAPPPRFEIRCQGLHLAGPKPAEAKRLIELQSKRCAPPAISKLCTAAALGQKPNELRVIGQMERSLLIWERRVGVCF